MGIAVLKEIVYKYPISMIGGKIHKIKIVLGSSLFEIDLFYG